MKRILICVLIVSMFSCKKNPEDSNQGIYVPTNPYGVEDSLMIEDEYFVFLDEAKYPPLMEIWNSTFLNDTVGIKKIETERVDAIKEFAKTKKLKIVDDDIFIYAFSGFLAKWEGEEKISSLISENGDIKEVHQNFYMQNTRARMQSGGPLLQNTRARMQENPEWGYDEVNYTSKAVPYLGGGHVNSNSTNKIWIIDSGIDAAHQDLGGMVVMDLWYSRSFVKGGLNPASDNDPFNDFWGHGTSCAGLAAAKAANAQNTSNQDLIGMTGVSPGAKLVSLKVFGQDPESKYSWVLAAINHAASRGRLSEGDILSLSLGAKINNCNQFGLLSIMNRVANEHRVYFVLAAGNGFQVSGEDANKYLPACINGERIFTVGSIDLDFLTQPFGVSFSEFSNFNAPPIDWVVPGNFIFSTYPNNKYAVMQGTSMSTALMAGLLHLTNGNLNTQAQIPGIHGESYTYPVPKK